MFLLTRQAITHYMEKQLLHITDVEPDNFGATFYYFTLGSTVVVWGSDGPRRSVIELDREPERSYMLPPNAYATVFSYEHFYCSDKVFGLFGQSTSLAIDHGLQLVHGPTIDPSFNNPLKMGLKNLLDVPVKVSLRQQLGKILFFDVSDTYPITSHSKKIQASFDSRGAI